MHYLDIELDGIDAENNEKKYRLSDFHGEKVILYFYPQDDTPVCTVEANNFKDAMSELSEFATVIGVSPSNIEDHKEFKEKYKLNFILLSDKFNELKDAIADHVQPYGVLHRSTFIIDENGNIVKSWEKVDVDEHIEEILEYFRK